MESRIGCSGFAYAEWQGLFYPDDLPQSQWLEYYAESFDTLELNVSFYRTPGLVFFKNLFKKTPDDFSFVVKIPQSITHLNKLVGIKDELDQFYNTVQDGLMEKCGAFLFQFPSSFTYSPERLELLLQNLDPVLENVVEFRHSSWWRNDVESQLAKSKICFSSVSYPGLPDQVITNTAVAYYRFHGVPKLYYSIYNDGFIRKVADDFSRNKDLKKGYFLFNNTATRAALENASYLQEYLLL